MLKLETNTKNASAESTPCVSPRIESDEAANEDKLSLLVKAAEKLVDEEQKSREISVSESTNISKLNAFVNSLKEAKNAQNYPIFIGKNGKPTRPFKAYPKESLSLPIGGQSTSFLDESSILKTTSMPLTVNTSNSPSASSSCSNSPIAVLGPTANLNNILAQNNHMLTTDNLLSVISALAAAGHQNSPTQTNNLMSAELKAKDLTSLNLNDLTTFDFTSLAFNPHDFCVQHRKRIQQAQERALKKQQGDSGSPRRRNSSGSRKRADTVEAENQVDSTQNSCVDSSHDEYMNYPPKKRHRIQNKKSNDDEPTSSSSSQTEGKNDTPVNSPSSSNKPVESSKTSVRSRQSSADEIDKDEAYRERRRKNNEAAKRSRDARRAKEDDIALRAALLERENLQLKVELAQLKQETTRLRCLLYNS